MRVVDIPVGSRLVDSVSCNPTHVAGLKAAGVDGLIAYLGGNLTAELLSAAHGEGMGVVPVNFSRGVGWVPSPGEGQVDAKTTLNRLFALAIPLVGLVDWCDLEGCGADPTGYLDEWGMVVEAEQVIAGLYLGSGCLLTPAQAYALPHFHRYWHALSRGIPEPACGFVLGQLFPTTACAGVSVDFDFAQHDFQGRTATWVVG